MALESTPAADVANRITLLTKTKRQIIRPSLKHKAVVRLLYNITSYRVVMTWLISLAGFREPSGAVPERLVTGADHLTPSILIPAGGSV
jgi:hypothetical protein